MENNEKKSVVIKDEERNAKFSSMLKVFNSIIDGNPSTDKVRDKLNSLKESCANAGILTYRQSDAIIARCDNYLNGTYGVDKVKDAFLKQNG